ncbi:MAG TPA: acetate--CoA ligase family protein [Burkholderiales bacterium]|nr:acetate--CoA ligase family protein [Burkholderiales bacterium]
MTDPQSPLLRHFAGRRRLETLDTLFAPRSIALVGASQDPRKIGGRPLVFLKRYGYPGEIYPINPQYAEVQGLRAFPSLAALPAPPEQVVVALPAAKVPEVLDEAAAAGAKSAVVFSAGFAETGGEGARLQDRMAATIAASPLRVLGPNCIGVMNVPGRCYGTFAIALESGTAPAGETGFAVQSGAMGSHLFILARNAGIGVGRWAATGNEVDVDVADCIAWMANDPGTQVVVCCLEACRDGARFRAALALAREAGKPVLVLKIGASEVGQAAAASHTGMLAGNDAVFDAVLRQEAALRVDSIEALLDIAYVAAHAAKRRFSKARAARGRLGVVTLSGGFGILMADVASKAGLTLPELPAEAQREILELVPFAAARNPIDPTAQLNVVPELLEKCLDVVLAKGDFDALVIFISGVPYSPDLGKIYLQAVGKMRKRYGEPLIVLSAVGPAAYRRRVERAGCLYFEDSVRACIALGALRTLFALHAEARASAPPDPCAEDFPAIPDHPTDEVEAKRILAAAGIPVIAEALVASPEEAAAAAARLEFPVAMKIVSPEIAHKTEIGGVLLGVATPEEARRGYAALVAAAAEKAPAARVRGVAVSRMIADAVETILGVVQDPVFGPVVMFGLGGVFVETLRDVTFRAAPFDAGEAVRMIGEVKGSALLRGARGKPPADVAALAAALAALSRLAAARRDDFAAIDVNPFAVLPAGRGAVALDALLVPSGRRAQKGMLNAR